MPIKGNALVSIPRIVNDAGEPRCSFRNDNCLLLRVSRFGTIYSCAWDETELPWGDGPATPGPGCPVWYGPSEESIALDIMQRLQADRLLASVEQHKTVRYGCHALGGVPIQLCLVGRCDRPGGTGDGCTCPHWQPVEER